MVRTHKLVLPPRGIFPRRWREIRPQDPLDLREAHLDNRSALLTQEVAKRGVLGLPLAHSCLLPDLIEDHMTLSETGQTNWHTDAVPTPTGIRIRLPLAAI